MAKSAGKKLGSAFTLCAPGDKECNKTGAPLPSVGFKVDPRFNYTTQTAHPNRSAAERRARGCEEVRDPTTKRLKFTGKLKDGSPDNYCGANSPPCGTANEMRASCPVQLTFIKGKPNLRFCSKPGAPGYLVPVDSPEQAEELALRACAGWPNKLEKVWPDRFFEEKAPFIIETARKAHPRTPWGEPGLGAIGQQPVGQKPFSSTLWLAGGTAFGFLLWKLLQRPLAPTQT